jgi:hypothetical protein
MARKIIGYESQDGKIFVLKEDALEYMLQQVGLSVVNEKAPDYEEFVDELLWWFYQDWDEVEA